ncbi:hypothetical protein [Nesterenkonia populi]|uniref:hypothetical protein n=1 Tax=Nesterenkonia populi TaxID=1591087 RepID=UPI0011BDB0E4|nr:hypothetical protein [Nesterenkonia populi]
MRPYSNKFFEGEGEPALEPWENGLLESAEGSLFGNRIYESVNILEQLTHEAAASFGARGAAGLYLARASAEIGRPDKGIQVLEGLIDGAVQESELTASEQLVRAALQQQIAMQLADLGKYEEAYDACNESLDMLPPEKSGFESFPVSEGMRWGARRIQREIVRTLRRVSLSTRASVNAGRDKDLVRLVRGQATWIEHRQLLLNEKQLEASLRDAFESEVEPLSGTRYMGRATPSNYGYEALLLAELRGHWSTARAVRADLGRVLFLQERASSERVAEALRLLMEGDAVKPLRSAVRWLRDQGPSEVLVEQAQSIVTRAKWRGQLTESQLVVIAEAAEFLHGQDRRPTLELALGVLSSHQPERVSFRYQERLLAAIQKLANGTGLDLEILERIVTFVERTSLMPPLVRAVARVVETCNLNDLPRFLESRIIQWTEEHREDEDRERLVESFGVLVSGEPEISTPRTAFGKAVMMANGQITGEDYERLLPEVVEYLHQELQSELKPRSGVAIGGSNPLHVAVALALSDSSSSLWLPIAKVLANQNVHATRKVDALERLAADIQLVPQEPLVVLRENFDAILNSDRRDMGWSLSDTSVFAPAIRFGAVAEALSYEKGLEVVMSLAAGRTADRVEACKTVPFLLSEERDSTWGHSLLLQASRDQNPRVSAEAAYSLVYSLQFESPLTSVVVTRAEDLLNADGVTIPLRAIHAVQRLAQENRRNKSTLRSTLVELCETANSDTVRRASKLALEQLDAVTL